MPDYGGKRKRNRTHRVRIFWLLLRRRPLRPRSPPVDCQAMAAVPVDLPPIYDLTGTRRVMSAEGVQVRGRMVLAFATPFVVVDVPGTAELPAHTLVTFGAVPTVWAAVGTQSGDYSASFGESIPVNAVGDEVEVTLPEITADDAGRRVCVTCDPAPSGNPVKVKGAGGQLINGAAELVLGTFWISVVAFAAWEADVGRWCCESLSPIP